MRLKSLMLFTTNYNPNRGTDGAMSGGLQVYHSPAYDIETLDGWVRVTDAETGASCVIPNHAVKYGVPLPPVVEVGRTSQQGQRK